MTTAQSMALASLVRAVSALRQSDNNRLADDLERDVLALTDECDQQRTRAEGAEAELRELRKGGRRG